ncbi:MAG: CDP-diacylglycerol--glycerol-3-phosphate 3-phosphatidyltransferase [Azospirillaceae bacterium]|nr:CDP-diacylglycerol--glycerol-3-phosphate 3-phosphatidyltransferase [Azospirillaceae bacterium]
MLTSLPNILTLSRIAVIPLVIALFFVRTEWAAWTNGFLFAAAAITDYFDGYLARARDQTSVIGKFLDPIADKLLVSAVLFMLVAVGRLNGLSVLPAVVILLREVLVSGLREFLAGLNVGVPVSRLAKWKTTLQMFALGFLIVGNTVAIDLPLQMIGVIGLWIAGLLTLVTGWDYMRVGWIHMIEPPRTAPSAPKTPSPATLTDIPRAETS